MALWRALQLLAVAVIGAHAQQPFNASDPDARFTNRGIVRQLGDAGSPGNVAACYSPFHNKQYPLNGGGADVNALRAAIEDDFRIMSQHFTHVRTYYAQYFGIEIAPIAAQYGIKLFLGVFLTTESWGAAEVNAAVNAIKKYSSTVEVVSVGNENLPSQSAGVILNKVNEIKNQAGADAWRVKYGTVQRITEFADPNFDGQMWQLSNALDVLGVNIYPFFDNGYDGNDPTKLLDTLWNIAASKYPRDKLVLTETGFPSQGKPSSLSPKVSPSLPASVKYYEALASWNPAGYEGKQKFWFQAFDRRPEDPSSQPDLEQFFGFFTIGKQQKQPGYPRVKGAGPSPTPSPTADKPTPAPTKDTPSPSTCTIEEGVDYVGNDISSALIATAEACFAACSRTAGCGAFSWTNYNGGTCWLKSAKGATTVNSGARSGVACKCSASRDLTTGVDYSGKDIANAVAPSASLCFALCEKQAGCLAFSWSDYNGGTCWLKAARGDAIAKDGVVSGAISC